MDDTISSSDNIAAPLRASFKPDLIDWLVFWFVRSSAHLSIRSFTQPPMRRMRIMFYRFFFVFGFLFFSVRHKNTRQPFPGTAEQFLMKLLPNDSGENVVCIAVPKWGLGPPINFLGAKNYTLRTWW